jgi:C1A family cysteine protease
LFSLRSSSLVPALLATLLAAGCGSVGAPTAKGVGGGNFATRSLPATGMPTTPAGHRLGYSLDRFHNVINKQPNNNRLPVRQGLLPPRINLSGYCSPIYDQGDLGCCTAFAIVKGLREMQQRQRKETPTPLSALFLYYMERYAAGTVATDSGATVADGMQVLQSYGAAPEVDWPFRANWFATRPTNQSYTDAANWRVSKTYHLAGLDDVKTSLARGYAVVAGFEVYKDFDSIGKDGWMRMPSKGETLEGGHAALVVGYDDPTGCLILRNSWGADWGANGYFYMPYAYAQSTMVDEYWTGW